MRKLEFGIGDRFHRLIALRPGGMIGRRSAWWFLCDCGAEKRLTGTSVKRGEVKSCGCLPAIRMATLNLRHGHARANGSLTYKTWRSMLCRCYNKGNISYPLYGARGIRVCEKWRTSFDTFVADMGVRPSRGHTIDRIDGAGHYEPGNCRWATWQQQRMNQPRVPKDPATGEPICLSRIARDAGINVNTFLARIHGGWTTERALAIPVDHRLSRKDNHQWIAATERRRGRKNSGAGRPRVRKAGT